MAQQDNYRQSGFQLAHRAIRFAGTAPATTAPAGVRPALAADLAAITVYDGACLPTGRALSPSG